MANCRHCGAFIEFLVTDKGNKIPINSDSYRMGDTVFDKSRHRPHFADCPGAKNFRKKDKVKTAVS